MAQIDPRIAMGFQPTTQLESPMNNLARLLQVQGAQQANQLNQLKMDEYQSGVQRKNKLAALLSGDYATDEDRESALLRGGFMDEANTLRTNRQAAAKSGVELDEKRFKLATDRYNTYKQTLGALSQNPNLSKDLLAQVGQQLVDAGIIPAEMHQRALATMPDDPNVLRQRLREGVAAQMAPDKMLEFFAPKADKIDNGQQIMYRDTNPNSPTFGQNVAGAPVQKMQTPDSIASNATTRRGQDLVNARSAEANAILRDLNVQEKQLKVDELRSEAQARSDAKLAAADAADVQIAAIDRVLKHPGRATGTGFSGFADPRNYIPGTNATDFRVALDQVKGTAFLQAFQSLKGGGAITEIEGKKAEAAIARLDRAQSDAEFESALNELRGVMIKGRDRLKSRQTGGASGSFDAAPGPAPQGGKVIDFGELR